MIIIGEKMVYKMKLDGSGIDSKRGDGDDMTRIQSYNICEERERNNSYLLRSLLCLIEESQICGVLLPRPPEDSMTSPKFYIVI